MRALGGLRLVRAEDTVRRDPAPSRWHYRWQRMMLTPTYRLALRYGLPVLLVVGITSLWFANDNNRARLNATWQEAIGKIQNRPEFLVAGMQVTGASPAVVAAVTGMVQIQFPISSWDLDLDAIRTQVMNLTAVRDVTVGVRSGGILEVAVIERKPVAVWRYGESLRLIDEDGVMTGMITARSDRADLPLIAGDGARDVIDEAMAIFAAAGPISERVRGLVRMGERRWDLILDMDQRILLPEEQPVAAMDRALAWHAAQELFERDVTIVDLRDGDRPTLRLSASAVNVLNNTVRSGAGPILTPTMGQGED